MRSLNYICAKLGILGALALLSLGLALLPAFADTSGCASRDVDHTIRECSLVIEENGGHGRVAAAYVSRALAYWQKGAYQKAAADSHQAIRLGGNFTEAYLMCGIHLSDMGDRHAALADFSRAIDIQPSPTAYYNRGTTHLALADYAGAITDFDLSLASDARVPQAYINRALAHLAQGHTKMALADIQRGEKLLSQTPPASAILKSVLAAVNQADNPDPQSSLPRAVTEAQPGILAFFPVSKVLPTQAAWGTPASATLIPAHGEPPRSSTLQPPHAAHLVIAAPPIGRTSEPRRHRLKTAHRPLRAERDQGAGQGRDESESQANRGNEVLERFRFRSGN